MATGLLVGAGACGVEVPDDVADRATSTSSTSEATTTTEAPTSDDELEQALLDNGYTPEEATCGAESLRRDLDDDQITEIIEADSVTDIDEQLAVEFADAIGGCLEGADDDPDDPSGPGRGPGG